MGARVFAVCCLAVLGWLASLASAYAVPPGFDLFETDPQATEFKFDGSFAIPADFFDPGSAPFTGTVKFGGDPQNSFQGKDTGDADTVVQRPQGANLPSPFPSTDTVPIELVSLSLVSVEPIQVQVGNSTQLWDVKAGLSPTQSSRGQMTITKTSDQGGSFSSQLLVLPLFQFQRTTDGATRTLDPTQLPDAQLLMDSLVLQAKDVPWTAGCGLPALAVPGLNDEFCPGFSGGEKKLTVEQALQAQHGILPAQPRLEHFKCYSVKPRKRFRARQVQLTDQFESKKFKVRKPVDLCNPVKKNKEPFVNKRAHLKCYAIKDAKGSPPGFSRRTVHVRNQFGSDSLSSVVRPETLCVPSTKQTIGHNGRPSKLRKPTVLPDHFKCYRVKGTALAKSVRLADQFGSESVKVLKPLQLCTPVQKNEQKVQHPVTHLVCYQIKDTKRKRKFRRRLVRVQNQFGTEILTVLKPRKLCVPSIKVTS